MRTFPVRGTRRHARAAPLAVALILLLGLSGISCRPDRAIIGLMPRHPEADLPAEPLSSIANPVEWIWSGGLTPRSIRVRARIRNHSSRVRLVVSTRPTLADPSVSEPHATNPRSTSPVVSITMDRLSPGTLYYYALEVDGELDTVKGGTFRTPRLGPQSFKIVFGSCARTGSNGSVFETMRREEPLFFLHTGDLHYENIRKNRPARFRRAYDRVLTAPAQARLYRSVPIAYVWDDHDYGANDSHGSSPSRAAAHAVYRESVPHYPLVADGPDGQPDGPIYQAFTIGRVRFLLTDVRSVRTPKLQPDGPGKSILGGEQKAWLEQELLDAKAGGLVSVWVNPVPWIAEAEPGADSWGGYAFERGELAALI